MTLHIAISGSNGRMGKSLQRLISQYKDVDLVGSIFNQNREFCEDTHSKADVIIDFALPEATQSLLERIHKPLLIGTTGHTLPLQQRTDIPVLFAPNTSVGIHMLRMALQTVVPHLEGSDIDIVETHHKHKKDAPSGTSLSLKATLEQVAPHASIQVHAIRAGSVLVEHEVRLNWGEESLVLTHRAFSRDVFARGALTLAKWLVNQKPGFYTMEDVFHGRTEKP